MKMKMLAALGISTALILGACGNGEESSGGGEQASSSQVLEFHHGYHQSAEEWPVAQVMRDLYDDFAEQHADGNIEFKATPVSGELSDVMNNRVASGEFPDIIDLAGGAVSLAAIEQDLVLDLKPYIDENNLESKVGLNYSQNEVDGSIYTVHEQLFTMGLWYNDAIFDEANASKPEEWNDWETFQQAMSDVRELDGVYAFGAGEPAIRLLNTALAETDEGRQLLSEPLTNEGIESQSFTNALKTVMELVKENGSEYAGGNADEYSGDFLQEKSSVFFNGVWASGSMAENPSFRPGLYPGNVAITSSGGGITISNNLSEEQKALALEFLEYMTSDEVQEVIFKEVGANPSNEDIDIKSLASEGDETAQLLGEALIQVQEADHQVQTISDAWGGDIHDALINALTESAGAADIDVKVEETKSVLLGLIN